MGMIIEQHADKFVPDPNSGCWLWTGAILPNGYGVAQKRRYTSLVEYAHRLFYIDKFGEIPAGMDLDHLCNTRCCVNPDHLRVCTRAQNLRRGKGTKLTQAQVDEIRMRFAAGNETYQGLAVCYGVDRRNIRSIVLKQSWRD